jgi:uncharacterized NAD(P)/FAD-binding protein YdhS
MKSIALIGGGASGLLVAANLLRKSNQPLAIKVIEPNPELGSGIAYGTDDLDHLLNVPASRMSAFVEDANSLCDWLGVSGDTFISRADYRRYLQAMLQKTIAESSGKHSFEHIVKRVEGINRSGSMWECELADGSTQLADFVVLATGHQKIIIPEALQPYIKNPGVTADVWQQSIDTKHNRVAIIGTGLTFYDVTLSYLRENPHAKIHGISRNGLLPSPHLRHREPPLPVPNVVKSSAQAIRDYLVASGEKWREAQDGIRHDLQEIWSDFPDTEKRKFLDKYFRWWNVLRHRSAPDAHDRMQDYISSNKVEIVKDEVKDIESIGQSFTINLSSGTNIEVDQIINCCGNSFEVSNPLIKKLIDIGVAKPGPLQLGISVSTKTLQVKSKNGEVHNEMFAIGPILVGELLETTAIPEIKIQANHIAEQIMNSK